MLRITFLLTIFIPPMQKLFFAESVFPKKERLAAPPDIGTSVFPLELSKWRLLDTAFL
jgi:hypothetical protein